MKQVILLCSILLLSYRAANAQITISGGTSATGSYATLSAAVVALNSGGTLTAPVVIDVAAGFAETLTGRIDLTISGDATNSITIQKNGAGANPVLTSYAGVATATSATMDGMFALVGSDYVTIDGINLQESAANTTATTTMEYGYGLFKASATDGANNNTIKNCAITLNRVNSTAPTTGPAFQGSNGITLLACTPTTMQTNLTVTAASGASSNNRFYSNTIQNVNCGVCLSGFAGASPFSLCDTGNDVGGSSAATGNTIINFGGGTGATAACAAVFTKEQWSANISYNIVDNNVGGTGGVNHPNTNRGIFTNATSIGASANINNNTVTIRGGTSTTAIDWAIDCEMAQSGANGNTININNNTISIEKTTATAVALTAIWAQTAPTNLNINGNTITNFTSNSTTTSTTDHGVIRSGLAPVNLNINNNTIGGVVFTNTAGTGYVISSSGACTGTANINGNSINGVSMPTAANTKTMNVITRTAAANTATTSISNNSFTNITRVGSGTVNFITGTGTPLNQTIDGNTFNNITLANTSSVIFINHGYTIPAGGSQTITNNSIVTAFNKTGAGGGVVCMNATASTATAISIIHTNNNFSNITVTGATTISGIFNTDGSSTMTTNRTVTGNQFNNWIGGSGALTGMTYTLWGGTTSSLSNNSCTNWTSTAAITGLSIGSTGNNANPVTISNNTFSNLSSTGTGGVVVGITCANSSPAVNIRNNAINTLSSTGTSVTGISITGATNTNVFQNKIYNLSSANTNPIVQGIAVGGGATVNVFNNIVGDLRTPVANAGNPLIGINVTGGTNVNLHFNTVLLNGSSSGALFGSSAISASTTPNLTMRNNIFVNNSTNNSTGLAVAYRRSTNSLGTYSTSSNNNLFFGSTLYFDAVNTDVTLAAFKSRMATRDGNSFFENPPFLNSTTGSGADYLHLNTAVGTQAESGGIVISGVNDDYDGDVRFGSVGYTGSGSNPDLGADEGDFTLTDVTGPSIIAATLVGNACNSSSRNVTATITDATGVPTSGILMPRIYFRKNNGTYASSQGILSSGTSKNGNWTFTIDYSAIGGILFGNVVDYYIIAQDLNGTPNINSYPAGAVALDVNSITSAPISIPATTFTQAQFLATGSYTVGSGGNFATFTDAVNAYNTSCLNGPVTFQLTDAVYNESVAILNNVDASAINTLTIYPNSGGTLISGVSANATIDLNGARYITIDGRIGGIGGFVSGTNLVVSNTLGTAPAFRFINETIESTVKYCDVQSNNSNTAAASAGVILFSTTTGTNGNDNNKIDFCDVHNVTGGNPTVGINANGTTTTAATNNDACTISNCNVYDYFNATSAYSGILINGGNSAWSIMNNRFYQTAPRTVTSTGFNKDIFINNITGNNTGSGFIITGNNIGGDNPSGSGVYTLNGTTAHTYCGIYCAVGTGTPTSVQGNTFSNVSFTSGSTSASAMSGITSNGGNVNIGTVTGNLVGAMNTDASISPSITYTNSSTTSGGFIPIFAPVVNNASTSTTNISNNTIAGISVGSSTTTNAAEFFGIGYNNGIVTITNNTIGSPSTAKSIYFSNTSTATNTNNSRFAGILISGGASSSRNVTITGNTIANLHNQNAFAGVPTNTGTRGILVVGTLTSNISTIISNNTIRDLTSFSNVTQGSGNAALGGIAVTAGSIGTCEITNNSIYNLNLAGTATTGAVQNGAFFISSSPTGTANISGNNIHSLGLAANNPGAFLTGMDFAGGTWNIFNNIIRLGIDGNGLDITTPCTVRGITKNTATSRIYHNSIYIGGSNVGSTATSTFALARTATAVDDWRNNILVNNRSNATTGGKHYAINLNATTNLTLNYNDYYGNGNGFVFGSTASTGADVATYTTNWVAGDANSYNIDPQFINPTGDASNVNLHISPTNATIVEGTGTPIATVTTDFDGETRSGITPTDMGADAGNFVSLSCNGQPPSSTAAISGTATPICVSGTKTLILAGFSSTPGLTLQWKESTVTGGPYTNVVGGTGATTSAYTTATLTTPRYYVCEVTCTNGLLATNSSEVLVDISDPMLLSTTPATRCGTGTLDLTATASAGADVKWYTLATGGTLLFTGPTFTTPSISVTTTYYAEASVVGCVNATRSAVVATVTTAPAFAITGNQLLCTNQAGPISVVTGAADYDLFTWTPTTGLYLDNALTQPYTGTAIAATTLFLNSAVSGSTRYTCNAQNSTTGCVNSAGSTVTFGLSGTATVASQPNECPGVGLVAVNVSGAGTIVNDDFSSGILPSNMTSAGNDFALVGGRMQFTSNQNSKNGGVLITNPTGIANNDFQIDFDMITTPGTSQAADGFSYSYGPDVVALPSSTAGTGVSGITTLAPENGSGTKLKLSFDAINNTGGCTNGLPASNSNGNTAGIYLMYNETTSHQGPTCPGVLYYSNNVSWRANATTGANTHVTIKINNLGQVSMWLSGIQVVTNQQLPAAYLTDDKSTWKHAFCARTGGLNQGHYIDNLIIQYNNYYEYSINGTTWTTTTPIPVPSGNYNVSARYISFPTCVAALGSVTIDPVTVTASSTLSTVCAGQTTSLSATPPIFTGGTHNWESSPLGLNTFTPIPGANTSTYIATVTAPTDFRCVIDCGGGSSFVSNIVSVDAIDPQIIATTPGTRCGTGTVDLSATANVGSNIQWFTVATGGTAIFTGPTFTTPIINTSTDYYVGAINGTCVSPRQLVTATVTPPPAIVVSPDLTICSANPAQTLSVTSANSNYNYEWSPATGLNTTTGATVLALPPATTTYAITATDPISGCVTSGSIKMTINPTPDNPVVTTTTNATPCSTVTLLAGSGSSQTATISMGTGTGVNTTTTWPCPIGNWYKGQRHQFIYTKAELDAIGMNTGSLLNAISMIVVTNNTTTALTDYTVKVGHTTKSAFTSTVGNWEDPTTLTTVFNTPSLAQPATGATLTLPFSTPFTWNGTDNIVIEFASCNGSASTFTNNSVLNYSTLGANQALYIFSDGTPGATVNDFYTFTAANTPTATSNRTNIIFDYTKPANYVWTPSNDLYTDQFASIPYVAGSSSQNVWAKPSVSTTYTVSAATPSGCNALASASGTAAANARFVELTGLGSTIVTSSNSCEDGGWTNYYANGKIFFAINWAPTGALSPVNSAAKNGATIRAVLDAAIAQCESTAGNKLFAMKRWWNVSTSTLADPVNVRFYHDPAEVAEVMAAAAGAGPTFSWFKNLSGAYNQATMVAGKNGIANGATANLSGTTGVDQGVTYVQFDGVTSFSGGTGAAKTLEEGLRVSPKVFLNNLDLGSGSMNDYMKSLANFPLSDPYSVPGLNANFVHVNSGPTASVSPAVLAVNGQNSIVDWMFIELRQGPAGATSVVQTRAALIQKDGDVVATDGVSPVSFFGLPSNNYIAVRHRNHLGFRTNGTYPLSSTTTVLDLTNNSIPLNGAYPLTSASGSVSVMNGGDANSDGSVDSIDSIDWETQNGLFDDYILNADYNLDGSVDSIDSIIWESNNGKYQELD